MTPEEVERLYREGMSLRDIADRAGVGKETIRRILLSRNVPLRQRGGNQGPHSRHRL